MTFLFLFNFPVYVMCYIYIYHHHIRLKSIFSLVYAHTRLHTNPCTHKRQLRYHHFSPVVLFLLYYLWNFINLFQVFLSITCSSFSPLFFMSFCTNWSTVGSVWIFEKRGRGGILRKVEKIQVIGNRLPGKPKKNTGSVGTERHETERTEGRAGNG